MKNHKRKFKIKAIFLAVFVLTCCQTQPTRYISPQIYGQILSKETGLPAQTTGSVTLNGLIDPRFEIESDGSFVAGPLKWRSSLRKSLRSTIVNTHYLRINVSGYHPQSFSYKDKIDYAHQDPYSYQKIDFGKIYLTPLSMPKPEEMKPFLMKETE